MFSINDNYQDEDPMFSSPPRNKQKPLQQIADDFKFGGFQPANNNPASDIPSEYAHDPDLYYAIQASLGQEGQQ